MPQSLANVLLHIVFSTRQRAAWIDAGVEEDLWEYLAGVCRGCGCPALKIGGTPDHVHILCSLSRTATIGELVKQIKTSSSKWIKTQGPAYAGFAWQNGYAVFSVGCKHASHIKQYIVNQKQHHATQSFQSEYLHSLTTHNMEYNDQHIWD